MDLWKLEYRSVIKFLVKQKKSAKEIHEQLVDVYRKDAPKYRTVEKWAALFERGRNSIEDDPRSGRPVDATSDENCKAVEDLVMNDRRLTVSEIAASISISVGSVDTILNEKLGMSKVCARWVPRNLTRVQKQIRVDISRELLGRYDAEPANFLARIVTGDETWLHYWDPETQQEFKQWKHKESPAPKRPRTQTSTGKIMASIFWDAEGVIMIDYMPHGSTITGQYYADLLGRLRKEIKEKRRSKLAHGVLVLHDNAPAHTSKVARAAIRDCGFEELPHPPYSPDLAPSDFYLFGHLKKHLRGQRFSDDEELKAASEQYLEMVEENFYENGIKELPGRWHKCIDLSGEYVE
jgi:histone-lysine N-methyltransferase SETMAR